MTRKVVVQGEIHVAVRDAKNLLNRDTSTTDACFIEGRSATIQLDSDTSGYILFLIGYLTLELIYQSSDRLRELLTDGGWDVEEEAERRGLIVEDEIDAELHEIWSLAEGKTRHRLYYLAVLTVIFAVFNPFIGSPAFGFLPPGVTSVFIACLTPLLYSAGLVILALARDGVRDDIISDSILQTAQENEYEEILVLCGQAHAEGIAEQLNEAGWDVERNDSSHPLAIFSGLI